MREPGLAAVKSRHEARDRCGHRLGLAGHEEFEVAARDTGLGEVAQPQDVANVVAFLASGLARHATGTTIDVNGASYVR